MSATIEVRPGEHIDSALRRFKKAQQNEGVSQDVARHAFHLTRSQRRRVKRARSLWRQAAKANQ